MWPVRSDGGIGFTTNSMATAAAVVRLYEQMNRYPINAFCVLRSDCQWKHSSRSSNTNLSGKGHTGRQHWKRVTQLSDAPRQTINARADTPRAGRYVCIMSTYFRDLPTVNTFNDSNGSLRSNGIIFRRYATGPRSRASTGDRGKSENRTLMASETSRSTKPQEKRVPLFFNENTCNERKWIFCRAGVDVDFFFVFLKTSWTAGKYYNRKLYYCNKHCVLNIFSERIKK